MMNTTYEQHELPASFTFRIVEIVKRIKIHAMPRSNGLPWGLSLAAGIAVVVMTFGSQMAIYKQPTPLAFPGETETLKVREMSVDILRVPGTSVMAGKQGDTDGVGMDQRSPQNTSLLAPAKGVGTWMQKADMPTARKLMGSVVVDGKIYVIGGNAPLATGLVHEYDPATDTWTERADMPTARLGLVAAAVDGIIYAIGGYRHPTGIFNIVEAYNPATDEWTKKGNMLTYRDYMAASVLDGKIYVAGGHDPSSWYYLFDVYDPATDKWTRKARMRTGRWLAASCVMGGKIYVSGGIDKWPISVTPTLSSMEVYDPATNTWTQASDMPRPRVGHTASVIDGKMYLIGGVDFGKVELINEGKLDAAEMNELSSIVDVYDPETDTWTKAVDIPIPRAQHAAGVVDGKIYVIGGVWGAEDTPLSDVYEYDPGLVHAVSTVKPERKALTTWGAVK